MDHTNAMRSHSWSEALPPRSILQDGRTILHHRCNRCGRDFAFELDGSGWHAAYIGVLKVELLSAEVSRRWVSEECPGLIQSVDDAERHSIGADLS